MFWASGSQPHCLGTVREFHLETNRWCAYDLWYCSVSEGGVRRGCRAVIWQIAGVFPYTAGAWICDIDTIRQRYEKGSIEIDASFFRSLIRKLLLCSVTNAKCRLCVCSWKRPQNIVKYKFKEIFASAHGTQKNAGKRSVQANTTKHMISSAEMRRYEGY